MKETCKGVKIDGDRCGQINFGANGYCHRHKGQAPEVALDEAIGEALAPLDAAEVPVFDTIEDLSAPVLLTDPADRAARAAKRRKDKRAEREGLGGYAGQKMLAHKRRGYHRHWFNDTGNKIEEMLDRGYDFVLDKDASINNDDLGTRKSLQVSINGPPVTAYLMEIPEKDYLEDQQRKEQVIQGTEQSIRSASDGIGQSRDSTGQSVVYNPSKSGNHLLE